MPFKLDSYFQENKLMLDLLTLKENGIARNIANVNTPDYKRVNVNFLDELTNKIKNLDKSFRKKNSFISHEKKKSFLDEFLTSLKDKIELDDNNRKFFLNFSNDEILNNKNLNSLCDENRKDNSFYDSIKNTLLEYEKNHNIILQNITNSTLKTISGNSCDDSEDNYTGMEKNSVNETNERVDFVETELEHKKELDVLKYKIANMMQVLDS